MIMFLPINTNIPFQYFKPFTNYHMAEIFL